MWREGTSLPDDVFCSKALKRRLFSTCERVGKACYFNSLHTARALFPKLGEATFLKDTPLFAAESKWRLLLLLS